MEPSPIATLAIIQARTSSSRLPGKVLLPHGGKPMVHYQLERLKCCLRLDRLVLATSDHSSEETLAELVSAACFKVFRGDLHYVLKRIWACTAQKQASTVVRLTGNCPLSDPALLDELLEAFAQGE